jgi:cholesterol transport system auxiliary component
VRRSAPTSLAALLLLGAALTTTWGCLAKPALVPRTFSIDPPPPREAARSRPGAVVSLGTVEIAPQFDHRSLVYRTAEHELERDPYAGFAAPPADMLTAAIREYLRDSSYVRDVVEPGDDLPADLLVEVHASELSGDFRRRDDAAAVLSLEFRVIDARRAADPVVLLRKAYSRRDRIPRRSAGAVVAAWNQALSRVMQEFLSDLEAALAREAAAGGR